MDDEPVSVQGDEEDGEGGKENTAGLDGSDQLTEDLHLRSPWPVFGQDINDSEWHGEGTQQDIRDGQGGDEHIPGCEHYLYNNCIILVYSKGDG